MAVTFRKNASRDALYALAVENGVEVAEDADRAAIIAALEAFNAAEGVEPAAEGTEDVQDGGDASGEGKDTTAEENAAEGAEDGKEGDAPEDRPAEEERKAPPEYDTFVYAGPTIPGGFLKENAVFRGTFEDVTAYLAGVLDKYPLAAKLIVPTNRFAAFSVRVKTPGNIDHKHYSDIVSAIRRKKEV